MKIIVGIGRSGIVRLMRVNRGNEKVGVFFALPDGSQDIGQIFRINLVAITQRFAGLKVSPKNRKLLWRIGFLRGGRRRSA